MRRSTVLVAREGRRILGFIVFELDQPDVLLHFVYTRHEYRRQGVARALLDRMLDEAPGAEGVYYTTPTSRFEDVARRYGLWKR